MKLPIGLSDFKKLRENDYYYIDKSLFIQDVIERSSEVLLLRYFLEKREESLAHLFKGLAIEQKPEIMAHQGEYPVIFLSFKSCKGPSFEKCLSEIRGVLLKSYQEHKPLVYQTLNQKQENGLLFCWMNMMRLSMRDVNMGIMMRLSYL